MCALVITVRVRLHRLLAHTYYWYNRPCRHFCLLTFCSLHSPRDVCWRNCQRRVVCVAATPGWLTSSLEKKKRAVSNWLCLGWGQAVCAGPGPAAESIQTAEDGTRNSGCQIWSDVRTEALDVCSWARIQVLRGSRLPGCSGTACYVLKEGCSAVEASGPAGWEQQPCLLPACTLEAVWFRCPGTGFWFPVIIFICLFTDGYVYRFHNGKSCRGVLVPFSRMKAKFYDILRANSLRFISRFD